MNVPGWIKTHKVVAACAAGALVLAIGGGVTWGVLASAQSPEVEVTTPVETVKPTSKPSTTPSPKPTTTTKPSTTTTTAPEEKPEQPRTDEPKPQNPGSNDKPQPPAPKPPAPQPPPAPEPPPPPPPPEPEPEPETPRGDANGELAARYGTNHNGVTRCGNANYGSATSAASLPPWAGVGNVGWSVWAEGDRWHVQYMSCE